MNILITGGLGFIGSHTAVALTEAGYKPIIIDNLNNSDIKVLDKIAEIIAFKPVFYQGDCLDKILMLRIFDEQKIDGVIHFAAYKAVGESVQLPLKYYQNNIQSLCILLEVMQEKGVNNLVFSSSCTVYGQPTSLPVDENAPSLPANSPYGNTKQICEEILRDFSAVNPFKTIALRYFNPIGAHPSSLIGELPLGIPNNLVPFITQTMVKIREKLLVFGDDYPTPDGTCIRDYIHVCDLAEAHVAALFYLQKHENTSLFDTFNIGTGNGNSVLEIIKTLEEIANQKIDYQVVSRRSGDITAVYAATEKASKILHWNAKRTLKQALTDAYNWQKTAPSPKGE